MEKSPTPPPVDEWIERQDFETTADVSVPDKLIDQVIGQEKAVEVIKKAAEQRRHVMLIGDPGTGKSMLARSMTELLPHEELEDIIAYPNQEDSHSPRIRVVPAGKGKEIVQAQKAEASRKQERKATLQLLLILAIGAFAVMFFIQSRDPMILIFGMIAAAMIFMVMRQMGQRETALVPKILVTHTQHDKPPFVDATGAHAGSLLGDVRHDPFQSGGLETPAHERVEPGAIHKAHRGVLFVDEINVLRMESQQSLLTALQEKKFSIMGQSERSSGAMVKTEAVPCDFILVAAGNLDALKGQEGNPFHQGMHPALRSRIRGYGYEVFMRSSMEDTAENRMKLVRFVAQEIKRDTKIPHFDRRAVSEVLREAQRRAGRRGYLTLRLRELGGLVRVAGDVANEEKAPLVTAQHVAKAKTIARSLEQQLVDQMIERRRDYRNFRSQGGVIGVVNGLAVMGGGDVGEPSGMVMPIAAEVTPASSKHEGKIIATGKLGEIAKEAVHNVSALIKKYTGEDIANHDVHIQFVGTYEGVEGDSASISIATAVISALEGVEIDQEVAMTGSLSVRGEVLPIGGVTAKIEAAAEAGMKKAIIPRANLNDVLIDEKYKDKIQIVPVDTLEQVLDVILVGGSKKQSLLQKLAKMVVKPQGFAPPTPEPGTKPTVAPADASTN
ncbi:MAG TPA: ATP-dependent protease LonB [Candidatus Thermoplasmatota archaeon]|nr:ATP-dependent protease LonB [Candidatus Thermoplasmatota archaeon]